jgi:hypothetical protein
MFLISTSLSYEHSVSLEGRVEVMGRRGRICNQLLKDLEETRGLWKLKGKALGLTLWKIRFKRGDMPFVRQTTKLIN